MVKFIFVPILNYCNIVELQCVTKIFKCQIKIGEDFLFI